MGGFSHWRWDWAVSYTHLDVYKRQVQSNGGIGTYVGIGTDTTQPVHNPEFDLDEECIPAAVELCMNALEEIHGIK